MEPLIQTPGALVCGHMWMSHNTRTQMERISGGTCPGPGCRRCDRLLPGSAKTFLKNDQHFQYPRAFKNLNTPQLQRFWAIRCCASVRWGWQQACSARFRKVFENIFRCFAVIHLSATPSCELQFKVVRARSEETTWVQRVQGPGRCVFTVSGFGKEFGKLG